MPEIYCRYRKFAPPPDTAISEPPCAIIEKEVSRAISVFQCRVSGVIPLIISFFLQRYDNLKETTER